MCIRDRSNNVGIKTRVIDYESTGESGQDAGQTADNEDSNSDQSEAKSEEQKQEEAKKEDTASDTANTEDTKEDTSKDKTDAENTNEGELKPNGVNPAIRLTESARTIKVGETFDILSVIDQVVDDQDDVSVLSRRIHADEMCIRDSHIIGNRHSLEYDGCPYDIECHGNGTHNARPGKFIKTHKPPHTCLLYTSILTCNFFYCFFPETYSQKK